MFLRFLSKSTKLIKEKNNTKQHMNLDICLELVGAKVHLTPSGPSQMAVGLKALVPSDFAIVQPCTSVVGMRTDTNSRNDKKQAPTLYECYAAQSTVCTNIGGDAIHRVVSIH